MWIQGLVIRFCSIKTFQTKGIFFLSYISNFCDHFHANNLYNKSQHLNTVSVGLSPSIDYECVTRALKMFAILSLYDVSRQGWVESRSGIFQKVLHIDVNVYIYPRYNLWIS